MNVMALACVAMMEKAMAYHGIVLPATHVVLDGIRSAPAPEAEADEKRKHPASTNQSKGRITSQNTSPRIYSMVVERHTDVNL